MSASRIREIVELGLTEAVEDHAGLYNHFRIGGALDVHKCYGCLWHEVVAGLLGDRLAGRG